MTTYHIHRGGQTLGPFIDQEIFDLLKSKQIALEDLAYADNDPQWTPLANRLGPKALKALAEPAKERRGIVSQVLLAFLFSAALISVASIYKKPAAPPSASASERNYYGAVAEIRRRLKAPSTATFGDYRPGSCAALGNGLWHALGVVEAQNAFGVPLRQQWEVISDADTIFFLRLGSDHTGSREKAMAKAEALSE